MISLIKDIDGALSSKRVTTLASLGGILIAGRHLPAEVVHGLTAIVVAGLGTIAGERFGTQRGTASPDEPVRPVHSS